MKSLFPASVTLRDQTQSRLMLLAACFLACFSLILTLSPAVRMRTWDVEYRWTHWIGFLLWLGVAVLLHRNVRRFLPECDPYLLPVTLLLAGWGLLTIWRLDQSFGIRQAAWLVVCALVFCTALRFQNLLLFLRRYKYVWLVGGLLLTILTFFFGTYPGGSGPRLWLGWSGVFIQPSEPLKFLLIVYLAAYLADRIPFGLNLIQLIAPTIVLAGASLGVLLLQRDLGTASIFIIVYSLLIFLVLGRRRFLIVSSLILVAAGFAGYRLFDVIRIRVDAWINPWLDPSGRSYQIVQSLLAVAAGGFGGRGVGIGSPGLVPVSHSDFIFSSIAEETGLLGTMGILLLFTLLTLRGLVTSVRAASNYQRFLAGGLTIYLFVQGVLIMGGNLRLLPLTGVTLPFVSYGGSSLLTSFLALLILLWISNLDEEEPYHLPGAVPHVLLGALTCAAILALAVVNGWWVGVRSDELLSRTDNPRRSINDRYVRRGSLLDRGNQPISVTSGAAGDYARSIQYPPLSNIVGYTSPGYGQSALESSLDPYLRGVQGNPSSTLWIHHLLYGTPPPGLDVRLSLDLSLQTKADELLGQHTGSLVLLNASTGEILAMASHPTFDANHLEENWGEWIQSPDAPLLNRAVQGQYPPGTALSPFLLALVNNRGSLPDLPPVLSVYFEGARWDCSLSVTQPADFGSALSGGCPNAQLALSSQFSPAQLAGVLRQLGLDQSPILPLESAPAPAIETFSDAFRSGLGQEAARVTPLQMALAAAAISNNGVLPAPRLAAAFQSPAAGWVVFPATGKEKQVLPSNSLPETMRMLAMEGLPAWQASASAWGAQGKVSWFLAGTSPDWKSSPLAVAVLLEEDDPVAARAIGSGLLQATLR